MPGLSAVSDTMYCDIGELGVLSTHVITQRAQRLLLSTSLGTEQRIRAGNMNIQLQMSMSK